MLTPQPPKPTGKITAPGVYNLTMAEYHGQPCDALSLSASGVQILTDETPLHLVTDWNTPREAAKKADIGTAIHLLILEPFREEKQIVVIDADAFRSDKAKAERDRAINAGKTPLLVADYEKAKAAAKFVLNHDEAAPLFEKGTAEASWFAKDKATGVWVKARPDWMTPDWRLIDIKSVGSCNDEFLQRRIKDGGWFQSAPWQAHVIERVTGHPLEDFMWLCVEQDAPNALRIVRPTEPTLIHGARLNEKALHTFARCAKTNTWPGYRAGVTELGLTDGALYALEAAAVREEEVEATRAAALARRMGTDRATPFI